MCLTPSRPGGTHKVTLIDIRDEIDTIKDLLRTLNRSILQNPEDDYHTDVRLIDIIDERLDAIDDRLEIIQSNIH